MLRSVSNDLHCPRAIRTEECFGAISSFFQIYVDSISRKCTFLSPKAPRPVLYALNVELLKPLPHHVQHVPVLLKPPLHQDERRELNNLAKLIDKERRHHNVDEPPLILEEQDNSTVCRCRPLSNCYKSR